jgi:hypothetical protein
VDIFPYIAVLAIIITGAYFMANNKQEYYSGQTRI